tara:strand:- start:1980 stop:3728 length:1749 start_codon:yes stop_codon:yes gene_type:complete
VSQSPLASGAIGEDAPTSYLDAWGAVTQFLRRGFSWSGNERNVLQLHTGTNAARYVDVSGVSGIDFPEDGRAASRIDWDGDGDLDLVLTARTAPRLRILRNDQATGNGSLTVRLEDARGGTGGTIGARVEVTLDLEVTRIQIATRRAGSGFLAQATGDLLFGLGDAPGAKLLRVRWPNGVWEDFGSAPNHSRLVLRQGTGVTRLLPSASFGPVPVRPLTPLPQTPAAADRPTRLVTRAPIPMPQIAALGAAGARMTTLGTDAKGNRGAGHPILVQLVSHTCAPCAVEMTEFGERMADWRAARLDVIALSVDPKDEWSDWQAFVQRVGFQGTAGIAAPETIDMLDALQSELLQRDARIGIPTSFLIDARGDLQVVYFGRTTVDQVLLDLELANLRGIERRMAAVPFRGVFLNPQHPTNLEAWERVFESRGQPGVAADFLRARQHREIVGQAGIHLEHGRARLQQQEFDLAGRHFEAALEADPRLADAWKGLGYCRHRLELYGPAIEAYREALRLEPEDERTLLNLGLALVEVGEGVAAGELRDQLIQLRSPDAIVLQKAIATKEKQLQDDAASEPLPTGDGGR